MSSNSDVQILLATYNGEKWLARQLDSLLAQDYSNFEILVRDDGSKDGTIQILQDYIRRHSDRVKLLVADSGTGSAKGNFNELMKSASADYIFWCDHDDIWKENKLSLLLSEIKRLERESGPETPIYVFSDAEVINASDETTHSSYWSYKKINPRYSKSLRSSLVFPSILGCTSVINKALLKLVVPVPDDVTGHDWWAHLVALCFGRVGYLNKQTIYYRLHGSNVSQQRKISVSSLLSQHGKVERVRRGLRLRCMQAKCLLERFDNLPPEKREIVNRFVALSQQNFLRRRFTILSEGFLYPDKERNLAMFLLM